MRFLIVTIILIFSTTVFAEKIKYELYELSTGNLIGKGVRQYTVNDVILNPYSSRERKVVEKFIELEQGFKVGARIFFEPKLTGFGLIAELDKGDFSWEWYNQADGRIFKKLQGSKGLVKIRVSGLPMMEILEEIIFLDDARLSFHYGGTGKAESHTIKIKKGSVFRFD